MIYVGSEVGQTGTIGEGADGKRDESRGELDRGEITAVRKGLRFNSSKAGRKMHVG